MPKTEDVTLPMSPLASENDIPTTLQAFLEELVDIRDETGGGAYVRAERNERWAIGEQFVDFD